MDTQAGGEVTRVPDANAIRDDIIEGIKTVYDPEIPVNVFELGLIYDVRVDAERRVEIDMTLTSPMCPTAQWLVGQVDRVARSTPHVAEVQVELVWDPPWDPERMSEAARMELGFE